MEQGGVVIEQTNTKKTIVKRVITVLLAVLLFGTGWLVGAGKIGPNSASNLSKIISDDNSSKLPTDGLQEIYDKLNEFYDGEVSSDDILNGLKTGAVSAVGDTYTEFLDEEETKEFNSDLNGKFEGIGAELGSEGSFIIIISPIKGTPAEKAGIQPQDIIIEIDGEPSTDITITEAVKRIRGEKGTTVTLTIIREGEQLIVPIVRESIDIPSVEWRVEDSIGIIEIGRFGTDTTNLVEKAAKEMTASGIKKIVLDMRGNPGGLLDEAVGVSGVWLLKGSTVLEEKRGGETIKTFTTSNNPIFKDIETVILINKGSASASEIVAGALRDNGVASLLGETSYGKGSVQQIMELSGGGSLKVTIARWFTPKGKNIDKEGIEPDTKVEMTSDDIKAKLDPQLDAAIKQLSN